MRSTFEPAESCAIAFKEWARVADALGDGRQSLILRKGGVSEESGEFRPDHRAFWLYPTFTHEAEQGLRSPGRSRIVEEAGTVELETLVVVDWVGRIERLDQLAGLEPFHDWTSATILRRFHYRSPGLWAVVVRAFRRLEPWRVAITGVHLGCKTWIPLEAPPPPTSLAPVLEPEVAARRLDLIRSAVQNFPGSDMMKVDDETS